MKKKAIRSPQILYEDNHLLAVYKPVGWRTAPDGSEKANLLDWAKNWIKEKYQKPGNVFLAQLHRLDTRVEGVLLFARTSKAASRLSQQFRERQVRKEYFALTSEAPKPPTGKREGWLKKVRGPDGEWRAKILPREEKGAKWASLWYTTIRRGPFGALLQVVPHTGRFHQIRALLAQGGTPLLGDNKYGGPSYPLEGGIGLQCSALQFLHPTRKETILLRAPYPPHWPLSEALKAGWDSH